MAKPGAAIEAAIARITKKHLQPAIREMRAAVKRMQKAVEKGGRSLAARSRRGGSRRDVDAGPPMSARDIKALRARLGMTQAAFARATGVTHVAVYFWESGRTQAAGERLLRLRELEAEAAGKAPARRAAAGSAKAGKKRATKKTKKRTGKKGAS